MSKPMTLGEVLDKWEGKGRATFGQTGGAIHDFTQDLRRILHGTDEPCPDSYRSTKFPYGHGGCPTCHGTGRLKAPGLGDRLRRAFLCGDGTYAGPETTRLLEAIRREIGEATP